MGDTLITRRKKNIFVHMYREKRTGINCVTQIEGTNAAKPTKPNKLIELALNLSQHDVEHDVTVTSYPASTEDKICLNVYENKVRQSIGL